ncbi:hypothetical protein TYRP_021076 [Tyrophagus putrescentiae]|nr:hypothetical protein TYRP_021076 [Tyrophagus putrescentiae]
MYELKKFTHFSYYFTKELIEQHNSRAFKYAFYLDLLLFIYSFHYLEVAFFLWGENSSTYPRLFEVICANDAFCFFFSPYRFKYDAFVPTAIFLGELFNVYSQLKLTFWLDVSKATWRWWHQLTVRHQEAYWRAQLTGSALGKVFEESRRREVLKIRSKIEKVLLPWIVKLKMQLSLKNVNRTAFYRHQLTYFPRMSPRIRRLTLLAELALDTVYAPLQYILCVVIVLYYAFFSPPMLLPFEGSPYYLLTFTFLSLEFALFGYCLMRMIRSSLFFAYCSLMGVVVYVVHLLEIDGQAKGKLKDFDGKNQLNTHQRLIFSQFLRDHNRICFFVLQGSRDLFGGALYAFLMTMIPIHIYAIRRWTFTRQDAIDHLLTATVLSIQTAALVIVLGPLAHGHKVFHSPKKWVNNFQLKSSYGTGCSRSSWLRLKLKYDDLFHRLSFGPKVAVSMGPMSPVTIGSVLERRHFLCGFIGDPRGTAESPGKGLRIGQRDIRPVDARQVGVVRQVTGQRFRPIGGAPVPGVGEEEELLGGGALQVRQTVIGLLGRTGSCDLTERQRGRLQPAIVGDVLAEGAASVQTTAMTSRFLSFNAAVLLDKAVGPLPETTPRFR